MSTMRLLAHDMTIYRQRPTVSKKINQHSYHLDDIVSRQDSLALIAKSRAYIATTARTTVNLLVVSPPSPPTNAPTISRVKPSTSRHNDTITAPTIIRGRRRPQRDVLSSATTPTMGWTIRPDRGPAIQTRLTFCFDRPRLRRYGVQSANPC